MGPGGKGGRTMTVLGDLPKNSEKSAFFTQNTDS
jgi:hypothetical protein